MLFGEKTRIGSGKKTGSHPERMEEETEYPEEIPEVIRKCPGKRGRNPEDIRKKYRNLSGNRHEGRREIRNLSGRTSGSHPEIVMKDGVKSGTYPEKHPDAIRAVIEQRYLKGDE